MRGFRDTPDKGEEEEVRRKRVGGRKEGCEGGILKGCDDGSARGRGC